MRWPAQTGCGESAHNIVVKGHDMGELRIINEQTGLFEVPRTEEGKFRRYLNKHDLACDRVGNGGGMWPEGSERDLQESNAVVLQLIHPEKIGKVEEFYQSWKSASETEQTALPERKSLKGTPTIEQEGPVH